MKKKLKWILVIGSAGLFVTLGLTIWAFISLISFGNEKLQSLNLSPSVATLQQHVNLDSAFNTHNCWIKVQSLAHLTPWLERPLADTFNSLKTACLKSSAPEECKGENCNTPSIENKPLNEGEII
jgi:hypothetical protein